MTGHQNPQFTGHNFQNLDPRDENAQVEESQDEYQEEEGEDGRYQHHSRRNWRDELNLNS